jgi:hypothetical protein
MSQIIEGKTNLKLITSENIPTSETLPVGYAAFGTVTGTTKMFLNATGNVEEFVGQQLPTLATVATTGDYHDLINTPVISNQTYVNLSDQLDGATLTFDIDINNSQNALVFINGMKQIPGYSYTITNTVLELTSTPPQAGEHLEIIIPSTTDIADLNLPLVVDDTEYNNLPINSLFIDGR